MLSLNLRCEKDNNYGYSSFDIEYYSGERISGNINMQTQTSLDQLAIVSSMKCKKEFLKFWSIKSETTRHI